MVFSLFPELSLEDNSVLASGWEEPPFFLLSDVRGALSILSWLVARAAHGAISAAACVHLSVIINPR